ncbi:hypothetical protein PHLGIDRAFT_105991 [Phlebiopsis gigantea 11061_1 CR5-6]|uniref:NADP-dependent oxidoreductase domain-containing protein n=1 Tax=Phlebiopsis gigantea (strain 11061_1 CR5-6) TaxID=745531 RepID=A0A0C3PLD5_PHLG1|nr:hypothetical protein PHLGIDRAFT_105991 [Phlebiopsis gigantea 11061_1 CR5-6]
MSPTTRKIGSTDVSALGYGCMGLSGFYGPVKPDEERLQVLDAAYEKGIRLWDTADLYGDSEDLIGKWFKRTGKRGEVFLATKFGFVPDSDPAKGFTINGTPEYVKEALDKSLKRLGVEQIDLWYLHRPDANVPIELTIAAMAEGVKAGKVKYIGISECSLDTLRRAHAVHPISAAQFEYAAFTLDTEKVGIFQACQELGIAFVAYSPLGRGLLTGTLNKDTLTDGDMRKAIPLPRFQAENEAILQRLLETISAIGAKHGATTTQVALAWLLAQGDNVIPIPGTTKVSRLEENVGALKLQLSEEESQAIRKAAESFADVPANAASHASLHFVDTPKLAQ